MKSPITNRARQLRQRSTEAEKTLWGYLRNSQLSKKIIRQQPLIFYYNNHKRYFIADFCCKESKLVIELDGKIHLKQKEYDLAREQIIRELGYKIIRFKNEEIFDNLDGVLKTISSNL